ncbi:MAG: lysyl oxidase family protein [Actinomycetota bacterium]
MSRARRTFASFALVLASLTLLSGMPFAAAVDPPKVRLFAATTRVTVERDRRDFVFVDPGVWVASVGGAFELRATRTDYDSPVTLVQTDATTGAILRTLPVELLRDWYGLKDFVHLSVRDAHGALVMRQSFDFCPNTYYRARLDDEGPVSSEYPYMCGGNPFTRGMVWGIDDHWAVNAMSDFGLGFNAPRRNYTLRLWVDPLWVEALGLEPQESEARVAIEVFDRGAIPASAERAPVSPYARGPRVPTTTTPDAEALPDLVALPAWGISSYQRKGRDYLAFNATEWNAGPGTLVVEGFRGVDQEFMDAYQYFHVDGVPVSRAPVGQLEFHRAHQHWHFEEFTQYSILDADSGEIAISGKQSWCLANTDAIDLSVSNANWNAFSGDLFTMCGGPGAIWIREVLDVGWGDTYGQFIPGQAFDITDLPNGDYFIRTETNPTGLLFESTTANNIQDRLIQLRGKPGDRRVSVPPWHGIDTEGGCFYCS